MYQRRENKVKDYNCVTNSFDIGQMVYSGKHNNHQKMSFQLSHHYMVSSQVNVNAIIGTFILLSLTYYIFYYIIYILDLAFVSLVYFSIKGNIIKKSLISMGSYVTWECLHLFCLCMNCMLYCRKLPVNFCSSFHLTTYSITYNLLTSS